MNTKLKLTDEKVAEILRLLGSGITQKHLAKKYGVSKGTISQIKNNKIWVHIEREMSEEKCLYCNNVATNKDSVIGRCCDDCLEAAEREWEAMKGMKKV